MQNKTKDVSIAHVNHECFEDDETEERTILFIRFRMNKKSRLLRILM